MIIGDFNINLLKEETYSRGLRKLIEFQGLKQIIKVPTRVTNNSSTLIDLVITNHFELKADVLNVPKISDHSLIQIDVVDEIKIKKDLARVKSYKDYSKEKLLKILQSFDWKTADNLEFGEKCKFLEQKLEESINKLISHKVIDISTNHQWFSEELRKLRKDKDDAYLKARMSFNDILWDDFKVLRNEYQYKVKESKNNYIQDKIMCCGTNQKQMWKTLKQMVIPNKRKKCSVLDAVEFNGCTESDLKVITEKFNRYFIESIKEINESIPNIPNYDSLISVSNDIEEFKFREVNADKLNMILQNIVSCN